MNTFHEIEIGVKMKIETGPVIFGMDALQQLKSEGFEIVDITNPAITMEKTGESDGNVQMYFSGGVFKVTLRKADKNE